MSRRPKAAKDISELIAERDEFLASHPELIPFQNEINFILRQAGDNPNMRLASIYSLLSDLINEELKPELLRLKKLIDQYSDSKVLPLRRKAK